MTPWVPPDPRLTVGDLPLFSLSFLPLPLSLALPSLFLFFCALPRISVGLPTQRVVTEDFLWNKGDKTADDWLYQVLAAV
jgi:hypothetical protein